jgi:hypothetical protein
VLCAIGDAWFVNDELSDAGQPADHVDEDGLHLGVERLTAMLASRTVARASLRVVYARKPVAPARSVVPSAVPKIDASSQRWPGSTDKAASDNDSDENVAVFVSLTLRHGRHPGD